MGGGINQNSRPFTYQDTQQPQNLVNNVNNYGNPLYSKNTGMEPDPSSMFKRNYELTKIRALSIKDALEYIPRFDGNRNELTNFLRGCNLARKSIPAEFESQLTKLVATRITGSAAEAMGEKVFTNMQEVVNFFEFMFGNLKTVHELYGELAQVRQKSNEDIVLYSNRIKILGRNILKAAMNDSNINFKETEIGLDRVLQKYFLRGIKPDIRVRLIPCVTFDETIKEAVVVEREVGIYSQGNSYAGMTTSSIRLISNDNKIDKCDICGGAHLTTSCEIFVKALNNHNKKANEVNAASNSQNNRGQVARFTG